MSNLYKDYNASKNRSSHLDFIFYSPIDNYNRYREQFRNNILTTEEKKIEELTEKFYDSMTSMLSTLSN